MKTTILLLALAALFVGPLSRAQTTIPPTTYSSGQNVTVTSPTTISTGSNTVTVSSGAAVSYQAQTSITLLPGFQAQSGASFVASALGSSIVVLPNLGEATAYDNSFSISWWAPSGVSGIVGYYVYVNNSLVASVTTGTSYTVGSLSASTTYLFTVAAYNSSGVIFGAEGSFWGTTGGTTYISPALEVLAPTQ
jgi:hypothetical protein